MRRVVLTTPRSTFTAALQADAEDVVLLTVSGRIGAVACEFAGAALALAIRLQNDNALLAPFV
ncbi:MAG: hypothetical protein B7Z70_06900 [Acidithiobacillus ferrivorans]|uniref:Uncharacterized protein n=1 Tax=Acidithiobacillus ferrivorans TaxID=160808 RepID=A0A257T625_9PROT|nr:MAG: hypothetical protein B7Z70_06900 [Acidithiobacillus ferrivorans]